MRARYSRQKVWCFPAGGEPPFFRVGKVYYARIERRHAVPAPSACVLASRSAALKGEIGDPATVLARLPLFVLRVAERSRGVHYGHSRTQPSVSAHSSSLRRLFVERRRRTPGVFFRYSILSARAVANAMMAISFILSACSAFVVY